MTVCDGFIKSVIDQRRNICFKVIFSLTNLWRIKSICDEKYVIAISDGWRKPSQKVSDASFCHIFWVVTNSVANFVCDGILSILWRNCALSKIKFSSSVLYNNIFGKNYYFFTNLFLTIWNYKQNLNKFPFAKNKQNLNTVLFLCLEKFL
jgi:hypothetical protein